MKLNLILNYISNFIDLNERGKFDKCWRFNNKGWSAKCKKNVLEMDCFRSLFISTLWIVVFSSYFCTDIPLPLMTKLRGPIYNETSGDHGFDMSSIEYNLLFTLYYLPQSFFPLFGGLFLDKIGKGLGIMIFTALFSFGQLTVFISPFFLPKFVGAAKTFIYIGRFLLGTAAGMVSTAESTFITTWFRGLEISFAMWVDISIARFGSIFNNVMQPILYNAFGLQNFYL